MNGRRFPCRPLIRSLTKGYFFSNLFKGCLFMNILHGLLKRLKRTLSLFKGLAVLSLLHLLFRLLFCLFLIRFYAFGLFTFLLIPGGFRLFNRWGNRRCYGRTRASWSGTPQGRSVSLRRKGPDGHSINRRAHFCNCRPHAEGDNGDEGK